MIKKKTLHYPFQGAKFKTSLDNNKKGCFEMSYNKMLFSEGGTWRTRTRLKMRMRQAIFMSDNSASKMI